MLAYGETLRNQQLLQQIKAYREMVSDQTDEEKVLAGVSATVRLTKMLLSETATEKRIGMAASVDEMASRAGTACISYVGKANFGEAEKYVREFHLWSYNSLPLTIQISAVNGKFTFDFIQKFHSPMYVNAFQEELDDYGISYNLQDGMIQELPNIRLPWSEN